MKLRIIGVLCIVGAALVVAASVAFVASAKLSPVLLSIPGICSLYLLAVGSGWAFGTEADSALGE